MLKKNKRIEIVADDREPVDGVIAFLRAFEQVAIRRRRLSLGDYQVDDRLIVERKTTRDFAVSIVDGRLFKQMIRLASSSFAGALILEGTGGGVDQSRVAREALQGALITTSLILGIPVLRSADASETARLMVFAARQLAASARGGVHRFGYRPKGRRKRQLFILQGLPGVGPGRAARLLQAFGSVKGVVTASRSELQAVHGIGKSVASRIIWAVSDEEET